MTAAGLRRGLGIVVAAILLAGLFQLLRLANRPYVTTSSWSGTGRSTDEPGAATAPSFVPSGPTTTPVPAVGSAHGGRGIDSASIATRPMVPSGGPSAAVPAPAVRTAMAAPFHAPRPGGYRYQWTVNGEVSKGKVVVAAANGSGTRLENEVTPAGSAVQVDTIGWSDMGRTVVRTAFPDGTVCHWAQPLTSLQFPLMGGSQWNVTSSCPIPTPDDTNASLQVNEDVKVDGTARMAVSGQPVTVWVVERHRLLTEKSAAFSGTIESQSTELFSPSVGLVVYRVARTATPKPDSSTETITEIAELLEINPS